MPNWEGSNRKQTLPPDWPVRQLTVLRRDHHRCQWIRYDTGQRCLAHATDVDHIISYGDGGSDEYSNLQALCQFHHRRKSGHEGGLASGRVRRAKRDAAKPMHPGLMPVETKVKTQGKQDEGPAPF